MNPIYVRRTVVLDGPIPQDFLRGNLYLGENLAHTFVISAYQEGSPLPLEGAVTALVLRSDGTTVRVTGSCSGGLAFVTLSQDCYNVNGRVEITLFCESSGRKQVIYSAVASVQRSSSDTIIDQGSPLPDIDDIIDAYMEAITALDDLSEVRATAGGIVALGTAIVGSFPNWSVCQIWEAEGYKYWAHVPVTPGATYLWSGIFNSVCGAWFEDAGMQRILDSGVNTQVFTAPANAYYVNIGTIGAGLNPTLTMIGTIQREGAAASAYDGGSYVPVAVTAQAGAITKYGTINDQVGAHAVLDAEPGEQYLITGYVYDAVYPDGGSDTGFVYPLAFACNTSPSLETTIPYSATAQGPGMVYQLEYTIPDFADKLYINGRTAADIAVLKKVSTVREKARQLAGADIGCDWEGKKIVWFGTSIPAGGFLGSEHPMSYPYLVGKALGATVINEAVGSSCIHCKSPEFITSANPRGFNPNFEASSRCMTNTAEDFDWIIANASASFWQNKGEYDGGDWWQAKIRSFGFGGLIDKYLTPSTFPDLFVFDHGYNDPYVDDATRAQYQTDYPSTAWQLSFNAGMDFLIRRILSYRPDAKILIVGVKDPSKANTQRMQAEVAQAWSIPMINAWQYLGWSKRRTIQQYGHWVQSGSDYEWVTDSSLHEMTMFERWVPDGIHPHSYPGHVAEQRVADAIAQWMMGRMQYTEPLAAYWDDIEALIAGMIAQNG